MWQMVAHSSKLRPPCVASRVFSLPCYACQALHAAGAKLCLQIPHGVGKLREDDDLLVRMLFREQVVESTEFGVLQRVPDPAAFQHVQQACSIRSKIRRERLHE